MTSSSDDPWPTRTLDAQNTNVWTASGLIKPNATSTQIGGSAYIVSISPVACGETPIGVMRPPASRGVIGLVPLQAGSGQPTP
jgi:hypothetical protein